jgi:hypothetical protein
LRQLLLLRVVGAPGLQVALDQRQAFQQGLLPRIVGLEVEGLEHRLDGTAV